MKLKGKRTSYSKVEFSHVQHARITLSPLANEVSWVVEASEGKVCTSDRCRPGGHSKDFETVFCLHWSPHENESEKCAAEWAAVLSGRRWSEGRGKHGSSECSKRRHLSLKAGHNLSVSLLLTPVGSTVAMTAYGETVKEKERESASKMGKAMMATFVHRSTDGRWRCLLAVAPPDQWFSAMRASHCPHISAPSKSTVAEYFYILSFMFHSLLERTLNEISMQQLSKKQQCYNANDNHAIHRNLSIRLHHLCMLVSLSPSFVCTWVCPLPRPLASWSIEKTKECPK